ncbi:MAG TPA: glyoxalase superfamily protein [Hyphomicrobium sp.]|nr:glyoxalase superfamily protein [Hyphomicrobium sp.]
MSFGFPIPVLRIFDENAARAFYLDCLGFVLHWEHRFEPGMPAYMQISRGNCLLHLSGQHADASPGAKLRIPCEDVHALLAELRTKPYPHLRPNIENPPWGGDEMTLADPFSNRLTFFKEMGPG